MENVLINEFYNIFLQFKTELQNDFVDILFFLDLFIFILLFILFINPIITLVKEFINFIRDIILALFNPILYFILFSSGSLTYILYSLISARHYETMFLTYAFITIFLLMYNCVKNN